MQTRFNYSQFALRLGLAFVFLYAAFAGLAQPSHWVGFIPHFVDKYIAADTALKFMSFSELLLGAWLLTGYYVRYAAAVSGILLLGIILFSFDAFEITFRDVGLLCAAIALMLTDEPATAKK